MVDKLFYIIFNSYFKHGDYKNDIPPVTVFAIFMMAIFCLGLCLLCAGYLIRDPNHFVKHKPLYGYHLWFVASAVINYHLFYHKKRYRRIYEVYKDNLVYDTLLYRVAAFIVIVLLILSPFIMALFYNKLHSGHWV